MIRTIPDDVYILFATVTFQVIEAGHAHYSARAVIDRMRWHMIIERGDREFKCPNEWTVVLSRWFHARYPEHDGFFKIRRSSIDNLYGLDLYGRDSILDE